LHPEPEMRYRTEIHVRKVRNTETGGSPTPFDQPVVFQLNHTKTGMYPIMGRKTFSPMYLDSSRLELP
jgi:hypothetical protein